MDNKLDMQLLVETLDDLKNNPDACTTFGIGAIGDLVIQESNPGSQLKKFIEYIYDSNLLDLEYVENFKKIKDKNIEEYTYEEVLTALTKIIRGDRFISGELYNCVKNGTMLRLVERLYELVK